MKQNALCWNRRPFPCSMWRLNRFAGRCDHYSAPKETVQITATGRLGLSLGDRMMKRTVSILYLFLLIISSLSAQQSPVGKDRRATGINGQCHLSERIASFTRGQRRREYTNQSITAELGRGQ